LRQVGHVPGSTYFVGPDLKQHCIPIISHYPFSILVHYHIWGLWSQKVWNPQLKPILEIPEGNGWLIDL